MACSEAKVGFFGGAGAIDGGGEVDGAKARQVGEAADEAARGFRGSQAGGDGGRGERAVEAVGAGGVEAVDGQLGLAGLQGVHRGGAVDLHDGGLEGDRGAEGEACDVQGVQVDFDRQAEAALAGFGLGGGGRRQAGDGDGLRLQKLDVGGLADQREGRPVQDEVVDGEPGAVCVAQFGMGEAQRIGEAAGQAAENDGAAGDGFCFGFDEASAGARVGGNQDDGHQGQRQQDDGEDDADGYFHAQFSSRVLGR